MKGNNIKGNSFPITAIGASAGGLESFEEFFRNITASSGIAFILISHLDPSHASMLTEILQRCTKMPVLEVQDKMIIEPNHVYVIPPNCDMAIFQGVLQLSIPEKIRGQRMPIDYFFRSLAEDQGERSIGVILSGTGTDGTFGLRSILGAGGSTFVQDPATAKYDGMPSSAVRNDLATYILTVDKIPDKILSYVNSEFKKDARAPSSDDSTIYDTREILKIVRSATSHDFSLYKQTTIGRRIERRMEANSIESIDDYARYLRGNPKETQILFKELLINVTNFFRDPEAYDILKKDIIPQLFLDKPAEYCFRIWVPACATGEEAFSLAISLREYMDEIKQDYKILIYATDINDDSILAARLGVYPENIILDVSPYRLKRFFIKDDKNLYKVKEEIRGMITFAVQNVINDPPFIKLDFISCRNLLIYLEPQLQKLLISIFSYALKPGGFLFLGPAETISGQTNLFNAINKRQKFFKSTPSVTSRHAELFENFAFQNIQKSEKLENIKINSAVENLAELTKKELLKSYAPSSVVIDESGKILFVHGDTGKYLSPAPGPASLNIVEMACQELKLKINTAIRNAITQKKQVEYNNITVKTNGDTQVINLVVRPFTDTGNPPVLLMVSFQEISKKQKEQSPAVEKLSTKERKAKYIEELEKELSYEKENLIAITEESQASNEELKSTNEELQSTNEELQSTNEELDTSREEMQSVNEELITVNAELSAKIDQLAEIQNDLKNLLENINIGTIFLDNNLNIKRYTKQASNLFHLIPTDIGRPLNDINSELIIDKLVTKAGYSLEMFTTHEEELLANNGKWYLMRILPYRTTEEVVEGVVITFTDISALKNVEASHKDASEFAENILNTVRESLLVLDKDLKVVSANRSFYDSFKVTPEETIGNQIYNLGNKQWNIPKLKELLEEILPKKSSFDGYEVEHEFISIGRKVMLLNARLIVQKEPGSNLILLAIEDVTDRKKAGGWTLKRS
jgi:two-component system, chemotaxis family, CheB/CheR fusion protein